jgi:hypothetical protein
MIICPIAGWPLGTCGNNLEKKGPTILASNLTPPALSAMLMKPINNERIPINRKQISTEVQQVSTIPSILSGFAGSLALPITIQVKISVSPKKKHLIAATTTAIMMNADQILLSAILMGYGA